MTLTQSKHPSGQFILSASQSSHYSDSLPAGKVRINGEPFTIPYNQKKIVFHSEIHTFETESETRILVEYQDKTGGVMPVSLYNKTVEDLLEHKDEDDNWDDIDHEYAYKKFTAAWCHPIAETKQVLVKHEVIRHDLPQSDYFDIVPIYTLGWKEDHNSNFLCEFSPCVPVIARELAQKHGLTYEGGSGDSVEYVQINGVYVYKQKYSSSNQRRTGTYSEMVKAREDLIKTLEEPMLAQKRIKEDPIVSQVQRKDLYQQLSACLVLANNIDTNTKNRAGVQVLREKLHKTIQSL
jgi:hypothetical protein